ncbi:MAG: hypothetical protein ABI585_10315 [Betaproteobacteria bacterium]
MGDRKSDAMPSAGRDKPGEQRPRRRLIAPLPAALIGLGLIAGAPDASGAIARPDVFEMPQNAVLNGMNVLANDTANPGEVLIYSVVQAAGGALSIQLDGNSRPTLLGFKPLLGFIGVPVFPQYCIGDANGNSCSYLYISVQNPNVATFIHASDDQYATTAGTPIRNMQVLANDFFNPNALSISRLLGDQAVGGLPAVSPDSTGGTGDSQSNMPPNGPLNSMAWMLDYVPAPGFIGVDKFQYCVDEFARPGTQTCATVYVNVQAFVRSTPEPIPTMGGFALAGMSGVLGWLAMRLRRRG